MRHGFINNFKQVLALPVTDSATEITLDDGGDRLVMESQDALQESVRYMLTLTNDTDMEVVEVTGQNETDPNILTIARAKEGTTALPWAADDHVEMRLTASVLDAFARMQNPAVLGDRTQMTTGTTDEAIVVGSGYAGGADPILMGFSIGGDADSILVIGRGSYGEGNHSVLLGNSSNSSNEKPIGIGHGVGAFADHAISIGTSSAVYGEKGVAVGFEAAASSAEAVGVGGEAQGNGPQSTALGFGASANSPYTLALGHGTTANPPASIALGSGAQTAVAGSMVMSALPLLPASYNHPAGMAAEAPDSTRQASMQITLATTEVDLTSDTATAELTLPANTILLIDSLDWITTVSDTPGGAPEIQIGTDATNNATLLPATALTAVGLHERQTFTPAHSNGVTSVHVSVAVAATGTAQAGKLVVRGYVMEV